jgi:hypothetical protein
MYMEIDIQVAALENVSIIGQLVIPGVILQCVKISYSAALISIHFNYIVD